MLAIPFLFSDEEDQLSCPCSFGFATLEVFAQYRKKAQHCRETWVGEEETERRKRVERRDRRKKKNRHFCNNIHCRNKNEFGQTDMSSDS